MNEIKLTKEQYLKWLNRPYHDHKETQDMIWQSLVEATREPRKLYAWRNGVNVFFTTDEHVLASGMRAPELDIEYDK